MNDDGFDGLIKCGCWLMIMLFNFLVGGWLTNYLLEVFFRETIPFFWAGVIGLFANEFLIPIAVVTFILRYFNII